jgi:hypothetical protein
VTGLAAMGASVESTLDGMPLFWPAAAITLVVAAVLAGELGRALGTVWPVAFLLVASVGGVIATTLTPSSNYLAGEQACQVNPLTVPSWSVLADLNQTSLNVALFVPLGLACGLLPRLGQIAVACLMAASLPVGVELAQYSLPSLGRVCSTDDIAANLTGLGVGIAAGLVMNALLGDLVRLPTRESVGAGSNR